MKTVILTTFYNNVQAHMLQDLLRNEGIESMLQGELSAQVIASYIPGLGIQVSGGSRRITFSPLYSNFLICILL